MATDTAVAEGLLQRDPELQDASGSEPKGFFLNSYTNSVDLMTFIARAFETYDTMVIGIITSGFNLLFSTATIVIGILNYHSCPSEHALPVFLIVGGVSLFIKCSCQIFRSCRRKRKRDDTEPDTVHIAQNIFSFLLSFWIFPGMAWLFGTTGNLNVKNPNVGSYCNLYVIAFSVIFILVVSFMMLCHAISFVVLVCVHNYYEYKLDYEQVVDDVTNDPMDDISVTCRNVEYQVTSDQKIVLAT